MVSGPLGVRRPFAEYKIVLDARTPTIRVQAVGPFGLPRPFSKHNPPVTQERVDQCVISDAGRSFGAGVVSDGSTNDISELTPAEQAEAIQAAEKWCQGTLESTATEELERGEARAALEEIKEQIARELNAPPGTEFDFIDQNDG